MPLVAGSRLGPYEVLSLLGAGGMGEVYRARDPRLGRDVAIKVSGERFTERFEREARAVAALNHPNICTLHDVGPNFLVMELVEGPTLAERIKEGAIPLDEALAIARQIAGALEAAHEKGIVHRDLKPGNVKLTASGTVKVLDFGLAKLSSAADAASDNSPTLTMATQAGIILGTAAYMAPEQARGKIADKRADIWAFGVLIYEMLTGQQLFQGETVTDILAAVVKEQPDWSRVPVKVTRVLQKCLEKDPKRRLRDIGDVELLLEETAVPKTRDIGRWLWPSIAAIFLALAIGVSLIHFREQPPASPEAVRFQILPPEKTNIAGPPIVSPDGRHIAFQAANQYGVRMLWVRSLDSVEARALNGTEVVTANPAFWSPDSRYIAFESGGKLKKVEVSAASVQTVCELAAPFRGGAWSHNGTIVFGIGGSGLWRVSEAGGPATPVTVLDSSRQETQHFQPLFLPDGRHFLYGSVSTTSTNLYYAGSLDAKPEQQGRSPLVASQGDIGFAPSSEAHAAYLLFVRETTLMAQTFDVNRLELTAEAVPLAQNMRVGQPAFSVSPNGVLVFRTTSISDASQLMWFNRQGNALAAVGQSGYYGNVAVSPDGKIAAVTAQERQTRAGHTWIVDLERGGVFSRLNPGTIEDGASAISPDGRVAFTFFPQGSAGDIYLMPANGAGTPEALVKSSNGKHPNHWSLDGRFMIYDDHHPTQKQDLWVVPMLGDRKPIPFLTTSADETDSQFSPDTKFIAYSSDESGRREVYLRDFTPDRVPAFGSGKWQISTSGGAKPRWRRDGKELYYIAEDRKMMAVPIKPDSAFNPGIPVALFQTSTTGFFPYDVTADGRFLMNTVPDPGSLPVSPITVILNWQALLKK